MLKCGRVLTSPVARVRFHFQYCEQPLPCAPGTSPFHIKGEFYRLWTEVLAYHDQRSQGAVMRVVERRGLREFATQSFLSSVMYDVLPLPRCFMAIAEARQRDVVEMTAKMGRATVETQMKGVYARLLTSFTPDKFAQRVDQVINHFYDFAPVVVVSTSAGGAAVVRRGMPLCVAEWWAVVTVPFVTLPLEANGARDVRAEWRITPTGVQQGIALGDVDFDVTWAVG